MSANNQVLLAPFMTPSLKTGAAQIKFLFYTDFLIFNVYDDICFYYKLTMYINLYYTHTVKRWALLKGWLYFVKKINHFFFRIVPTTNIQNPSTRLYVSVRFNGTHCTLKLSIISTGFTYLDLTLLSAQRPRENYDRY